MWVALQVCGGVAVVALVPVLWASPAALAHVALRSSDPAANDTVSVSPRSIRLEFTEGVEVRLSRVSLAGVDSIEIPLAPIHAADTTDRVIIADIVPALSTGSYRVRWSVTSRDSHTIRGEYGFSVRLLAADTTPVASASGDSGVVRSDSTGARGAVPVSNVEFDTQSPMYAAIRWLAYLALAGVIGALFFRVGVLGAVQRGQATDDPVTSAAFERAFRGARLGGLAAGVWLLIAAGMRLAAQVRTVTGEAALDPGVIAALLGGTAWGAGWIAQVVATLVALGVVARGARRSETRVATVELIGVLAVLTLAVSSALSGHAAAAKPLTLAVAVDAAHVLAAGGWIGTLAFVAFVAIPATAPLDADTRPRLVREIVTTFSNIALVCVAIILLSGVASSWIQMRSVTALWTSPYGRMLLLKLGLVALVAGAGAYNWRVATPRLLAAGGVSRMRAVMTMELLFAVCVLGVTAVLVATPPPVDAAEQTVEARVGIGVRLGESRGQSP